MVLPLCSTSADVVGRKRLQCCTTLQATAWKAAQQYSCLTLPARGERYRLKLQYCYMITLWSCDHSVTCDEIAECRGVELTYKLLFD